MLGSCEGEGGIWKARHEKSMGNGLEKLEALMLGGITRAFMERLS